MFMIASSPRSKDEVPIKLLVIGCRLRRLDVVATAPGGNNSRNTRRLRLYFD